MDRPLHKRDEDHEANDEDETRKTNIETSLRQDSTEDNEVEHDLEKYAKRKWDT